MSRSVDSRRSSLSSVNSFKMHAALRGFQDDLSLPRRLRICTRLRRGLLRVVGLTRSAAEAKSSQLVRGAPLPTQVKPGGAGLTPMLPGALRM